MFIAIAAALAALVHGYIFVIESLRFPHPIDDEGIRQSEHREGS